MPGPAVILHIHLGGGIAVEGEGERVKLAVLWLNLTRPEGGKVVGDEIGGRTGNQMSGRTREVKPGTRIGLLEGDRPVCVGMDVLVESVGVHCRSEDRTGQELVLRVDVGFVHSMPQWRGIGIAAGATTAAIAAIWRGRVEDVYRSAGADARSVLRNR